jgi:hypothetical protein
MRDGGPAAAGGVSPQASNGLLPLAGMEAFLSAAGK